MQSAAPARQDEPAPVPDVPDPPPADDPAPIDDPPPVDDPPVDDPPVDDPPVDDPPVDDPPVDDPPVDDPPADDPPIPPEEQQINAVYRMKGGRELLTLTCLSNGASVELDVTGWMEDSAEPPAPTEPVTYTGHSSIVDIIFDSSVIYHLIRDENGTVRVDLDVA